jgi:hypothetical protein
MSAFGHKADVLTHLRNVAFGGIADIAFTNYDVDHCD